MKIRNVAAAFGCIATLLGGSLALTGQRVEAAEAPPTFDRVITLGDSFAAGTGIGRLQKDHDPGTVDRACFRRSAENVGGRLAAAFAGGVGNQVNLACIGSQKGPAAGQPGTDAVIADLTLPDSGARSLITLSLFGNDLRSTGGLSWPDVVRSCVSGGTREGLLGYFFNDPGTDDCSVNPQLQPSATDAARIAADALDTYRKLATKFPKATIRIVGYPHLFEPQRQERGPLAPYNVARCWLGGTVFVPLDFGTPDITTTVTGRINLQAEEGYFLDAQVDALNSVLRQAAKTVAFETGTNLEFVNVQSYWGTNGFCQGRLLNGVVIRDISNTEPQLTSFHPNSAGYAASFQAVSDTLVTERLDRKIMALRSMCQRVSVLQSNGGRTTIESTEEADFFTQRLSERERWTLRRTDDGSYTMLNRFDGTYLKPGSAVGEGVTQSGSPERVSITVLDDGTLELRNPTNPQLLVSLSGGLAYTSGAQTDMRGPNGSCAQRFQPIIHGQAEPAAVNRFAGKLLTLKSSCGATNPYTGVMDVSGGSKDSGAPVTLYGNISSPSQRWRFTAVGDDVYEISSENSGLYLSANWVAGGRVEQRGGTYRQKWLVYTRGEHIELRLFDSPGLAIDLPGAAINYGSILQMYPANATCAQLWIPQLIDENPVASPTAKFNGRTFKLKTSCSAAGTNSLLDVFGASQVDGASVKVWSDYNGANQAWKFTSVGADLYTLTATHSGQTLSAKGQWEWAELVQRKGRPMVWKVIETGVTIELRAAQNEHLAADLYYSTLTNGAAFQMYPANGTCAQKFILIE